MDELGLLNIYDQRHTLIIDNVPLSRGNTSLYGGDLGTLIDLMETSIKNLQLQTASSLYRQDQSKLKVSVVQCFEKSERKRKGLTISSQINHQTLNVKPSKYNFTLPVL